MKKLILCVTLAGLGFAAQAGDAKAPKDQAAPAKATAAAAAKSECCDSKKEAAACTSCCPDSKREVKKQVTTMLRSPKDAAEKRA